MAAKQALERLGVEVLIGKVATICDERGVVVVDAPNAVSVDGKAHSSTVVASERIEFVHDHLGCRSRRIARSEVARCRTARAGSLSGRICRCPDTLRSS